MANFRANGKKVLEHYRRRKLKVPSALTPIGSKEGHFEISVHPSGVFATYRLHNSLMWATRLLTKETPKGILISDAQSNQYGSKDVDAKFFNRVMDSHIGTRLALDVLKAAYPDRHIYIEAPHEARKRWGVKNEKLLWDRGFWMHVRENHPEELQTLLARAMFENTGFPSDVFGRSEVEAAESIVRSGGHVKGRRMLSRVIKEYLDKPGVKKYFLGRRRAKRYHSTIPKEHGFIPVGKVDFGGGRALDVLHYDLQDAYNKARRESFKTLLQED